MALPLLAFRRLCRPTDDRQDGAQKIRATSSQASFLDSAVGAKTWPSGLIIEDYRNPGIQSTP